MANILIVDDTIVVRKILTKMFVEEGHTIIGEAEDGEKAIAAYKKLRPDLITMDINMPVKNGLEACKGIISEFPEAKIIVLTAIGSKHSVIEAFKNGAKHYLIKPVEKEKAIAVVNNVLGIAGLNPSSGESSNPPKNEEAVENGSTAPAPAGKNLMFEEEMAEDRINISIDFKAAAGSINVFYATMISSLRKLLFSGAKTICFNFIDTLYDSAFIESIAEIIGLTADAGMNVEVVSTDLVIGGLKSRIENENIRYTEIK